MNPVGILSTGMVTGVGLTASASCAAIRCGITGFEETRFMFDGEWLLGCEVPLEEPWRGREKQIRMVVAALGECLAGAGDVPVTDIPLLLCVAEEGRPGRLSGLDDTMLREIESRVGIRFHDWSRVFANGRIGGVQALEYAGHLLEEGRRACLLAGVDSLLVGATLEAYHKQHRLLTPDNSNGFIPGEGAGAVLMGKPQGDTQLTCIGVGYGVEPAPLGSEEPSRADGLVQAFKAALADAGLDFGEVDYRITDLSGEQYGFKEAALALTRVLRQRKEEFDIWHPADCVGEVGAAAVPVMLNVVLAASKKGYAPGPRVIGHASADGQERGAFLLKAGSV
ncbi:hypothetical protein ACFL3S_05495 [Gemmatimonadota bacterium]